MSLFPTKTRKALLRAVEDGKGRIYFEAGEVFDGLRAVKVTAAMRLLVDAGWIRARTDADPVLPGEWSRTRTYYRLEPLGRSYIADSKDGIERGRR